MKRFGSRTRKKIRQSRLIIKELAAFLNRHGVKVVNYIVPFRFSQL
jgi:hypothetical protein